MELPRRERGDELLEPGELRALRRRLALVAPGHDLVSVIACAFDERTRMLPFLFADRLMAPAGVRAIGSALVASGFSKTRVVLKTWNRNFEPSRMRLDGRIPDLFCVSSMALHATSCKQMIADACRLPAEQRPLIVAGGPLAVYEPWEVFGDGASADVAVTGEEFVLLSLLEAVLSVRARGEPLRGAFLRARDGGALDGIAGLVYARTDGAGRPLELVDTGIQRLLGDLDELPHPVLGYRLLEAPGRAATLRPRALPAARVAKHSPISSLLLTTGCKFRCPYCPIPAYNQRQHRLKSPGRIVDEMRGLQQEFGLRYFFGTDDNFFNHKQRTLEIVEALASAIWDGEFGQVPRWGTEATVHDTLELEDHIPTVRAAGMRALWMGVEDMTGTLVKKGQTGNKTVESFRLLVKNGIHPMPMMMHHDGQPLYTWRKPYGLINQVQALRDAGAVSCQILMLSPATGSKLYRETYSSGMAFESVDGRRIEPHRSDGNFVTASNAKKPWRNQIFIGLAYLWFYNPLRLVVSIFRPKTRSYLADCASQVAGMIGLFHTLRRTVPWAFHLRRGKIVRHTGPPQSRIPMRSPAGGGASHDLTEACARPRAAAKPPAA